MRSKIICFTCFWWYGHNWLSLNRLKIERYAANSWEINPWSNFFDPHWELIWRNKWHPWTSDISTPPEIALGTHFHAWHGTKTTTLFLPADGEACWLLPPSLVSFLSGGTVQPENTYSRMLKVTVQVWESQRRININTNHSYHPRSSP